MTLEILERGWVGRGVVEPTIRQKEHRSWERQES